MLSDGEKELCEMRTVSELDMNSGTELIQELIPLSEMYVKQDSLTSSQIIRLIQYVKTVPFSKLRNLCSTEFFQQLDNVITKYNNDSEISRSLMSLLCEILYRGAVTSSRFLFNRFQFGVKGLGVVAKLKEEIEKLTRDDHQLATLSEEEKESIMTYAYLMKNNPIQKARLIYIASVLVGMAEVWAKKGDEFEKGKRAAVALCGLCKEYSLIITPFTSCSFLSLFHIYY
jgi:hypothetical protein